MLRAKVRCYAALPRRTMSSASACRSSSLWSSNHLKNGFVSWSSNAKYYKHLLFIRNASSSEQNCAIMKGKIMQLGIVHHLYRFQSKHISFSGKRGEKTWSNRSCFSQVWLGWWWVPQVKRWDWVLKIFVKNMSCTTNFVNSIFDWSQTFSFLALILMKYETSWKSMFKIYITYCNAAGTSFSRLGLRRSQLGGSSTPASRFFEQSFFQFRLRL